MICLPLSSNQKRLWILTQQDKTNPCYNLQLTYHLNGEINYNALNSSLALLFEKQCSMFSVFKQKDGVPYVEIVHRKVKLEYVDFSDLSLKSREEKIFDFIGEDTRKTFDIEVGPLFRSYLLKENSNSYFFHITVHHLIFDGWSSAIFVDELSQIYNNVINGIDKSFTPLDFKGIDYSENGESALSQNEEQKLKEFWRENLKDCPPELKFPFDHKRGKKPSGIGCKEHFEISTECTAKLKSICTKECATLFNAVLTLFGILLHKYTGENDICIGVPVSNRNAHSSPDQLFGLFVNSVVVRLNIEEGENFSENLNKSKRVIQRAITHSKLPFEKVVEAVNPDRTPGINPLFQVSLSWLDKMTGPMDLRGVAGEKISVNKGVSPFDFTFYVWETDDKIQGYIEYSTDLLTKGTINRLKENFLTLVNRVTENSETSLNSLSVISENEVSLIKSFSGTKSDYPKDKTIIQLFEEQSILHPNKKALVFNEDSYTYSQLNERANQLAATLRSAGVEANKPVGIMADKSALMIIGILGVLKSGGGYLPMDCDYPVQRINEILEDSGCKILLVQEKCLSSSIKNVLIFNLDDTNSFSAAKSNLDRINTSSDLAYIMYTSGTTGTPKGSMIVNYSVVRLVRNMNYIDLSPEDRILLTGAIGFDATTFEIWGALLNGATLYVAEKETILDPKALGRELKNNEITILWLTSSLFTQIAESRTDIFCSLKYLLVGGDALSANHINKVRKSNPELKVINGYGPTENTTFSTTYLIEKDFEHNIPIGKPISNSTAYIFDKNLNYQPIGVKGELYVGGDGLSIGYLNRDDLNSKSFVKCPGIEEERLYRTGDYARWLDDGNIEFLGRIDNQIKIRGFRVELQEIETAILKIEGVMEVVVKSVKMAEGGTRLAAFINISDKFSLDTSQIGNLLKRKLPQYMIPDTFKLMRGFPKTDNGKINRNALNVEPGEFDNKEPFLQRELTEIELTIHNIWSKALNREKILVSDNFFEIGGNSLMAISVFSKIESAFNLDLNLRVFFDSPRITELAEFINDALKNSDKKIGTASEGDKGSKIIKGEI